MSLTEDEIQEHAERIADEILSNVEYSQVYEDEELEDATEEDWQAVHSRIQSLVSISEEGYDKAVWFDLATP